LALTGLFIAITAGSVVATLSPTLLYRWQHGTNREAVQRSWVEGDIYGLKITQLLLPITEHRVDRLAKQKARYNSCAPLTNENDHAALGIVGGIGFLWLLGRQLLRGPLHGRPAIDDGLALCNISGVLLATIGGFGSLTGMVLATYIRGYNRICVFIGFFALFSLALLFDRATRRWGTSWRARTGWLCTLGLLLIVGVLDQTCRAMIPQYTQLAQDYRADETFIRQIEAAVPPGSMIFQLPYVDYVEHPPIHQMFSYDMLRPYLHSRDLRWSYGAMKGRGCAYWQKNVAVNPTDQMLRDLGVAGFAGIYIDRAALTDHGDHLERGLRSLLSVQPLVSENGRFAFFDLAEHNRKLRDQYTDDEWEALKQAALHPLWIEWPNGFKGLEQAPGGDSWRWCSDQGEMRVHNPSEGPRQMKVRMTLAGSSSSHMHITGDLVSEHLGIESSGTTWERIVCVPAGDHILRFQCDRPPADRPSQPHNLVFRVINFSCREVNP
jgi:phosphoglycerol transferase